MAVGFVVKYYWYQVGNDDFLYAFFSTIAHCLEGDNWGSRYPVIMNELYAGQIMRDHLVDAIQELDGIEAHLSDISPDQIIWDYYDLSKRPPWDKNISPEINNLANYFVTSEGENLLDVLKGAIKKGIELGVDLSVENV